MGMKMNRAQRFLIGVVVIHAAVTAVHAVAHTRIDVPATMEQSVFIGAVIILAPLIAAVGQLMRRDVLAASILFLSMVGAEVFGVVNHLIVPGADNIAQAPSGLSGSMFVWSAAALVLVEAAGIVVGALAFLASRRTTMNQSAHSGVAQSSSHA
jgi:hypothetical protein